jgi:hypothetical protein
MKPCGEIFYAHPGLAHNIAVDRISGRPTFTDDQYRHIAEVVTVLLPGMQLTTLRPMGRATLAVFIWDTSELVSKDILSRIHIPQLPKRTLVTSDLFTHCTLVVTRVRGGRLRVRIDVPESLDDKHPLAILRSSAIVSMERPPSRARLSLAVDNSGLEGFEPTPRRGRLGLIVNEHKGAS